MRTISRAEQRVVLDRPKKCQCFPSTWNFHHQAKQRGGRSTKKQEVSGTLVHLQVTFLLQVPTKLCSHVLQRPGKDSSVRPGHFQACTDVSRADPHPQPSSWHCLRNRQDNYIRPSPQCGCFGSGQDTPMGTAQGTTETVPVRYTDFFH